LSMVTILQRQSLCIRERVLVLLFEPVTCRELRQRRVGRRSLRSLFHSKCLFNLKIE
jgi:hypothetical protein